MDFPYEKITNSDSQTKAVAEEFAKNLTPGDIIILNGSLGTGKTFFVKSVSGFFGIQNSSSPSFAIVNEYFGKIKIKHFDFYRINHVEELYDIGFEDYISNEDSVIFIEWAELFSEIVPFPKYEITIKYIDENSRKIKIKKNG